MKQKKKEDSEIGAGEREIRISREFDAPRESVFDAWTEPDKIGRWWGPDGFTTTTHEMNFREGGAWDFIMHGPDGTDYDNFIRYLEIVNPEKLVYDHGSNSDLPPDFRVRVTFKDLGDKTLLSMRMVFPEKEARDDAAKFGAIEGGEQTLDHLAKYLSSH